MYNFGKSLYKAAKGEDLSRGEFLKASGEGLMGIVLSSFLGYPRQCHALETNPDGYQVPDLSGLKPYETSMHDGNKTIPGKETYVEKYKLPTGKKIVRLSINNKTFAYSIKEPNQKEWYAIRDAEGNGRFTEKYHHGEEFDVPEWLLNLVLAQK